MDLMFYYNSVIIVIIKIIKIIKILFVFFLFFPMFFGSYDRPFYNTPQN